MSDSLHQEWKKELAVLLKKIEQNPSADLTAERERVRLLNGLIARQAEQAAA